LFGILDKNFAVQGGRRANNHSYSADEQRGNAEFWAK